MDGEKTLWEQNIALWEKWTGAYTDTMFKAMEKTLEQSTSFRGQIDKAVNTAMSTQMDMMLSAIRALERQMAALSEKMDKVIEGKK